jgi:hypothetical protein
MFTKSSKKSKAAAASMSINGMCQMCSVTFVILSVLAVIAAIAALIGVYKSHFLSTGLTFGTLNDSASLIALVLTLKFVSKLSKGCSCQCDLPSKK